MAQLSFSGLQPVSFGGKECAPKLDTEIRLRISNVKLDTASDIEHAAKVFAEAFPDDKDYVRDFIENQMTGYEVRELQVYLTQGAKAAKDISDVIKSAMAEEIRKAAK